MSEIAKRADLVIGSLYQYFTDKSAIFRAILIRHQSDARVLLHHEISKAGALNELAQALVTAFDQYYEMLQKDRLIAGLWPMVQTDPELQLIDLEDTLQNARYVAEAISKYAPQVQMNRLVATCTMLIQFSLYAGRLALDAPADVAQEIPPTYRELLLQTINALSCPPSGA